MRWCRGAAIKRSRRASVERVAPQPRGANALNRASLVLGALVAADAHRTDDVALGVLDQHAARHGYHVAARRGVEGIEEVRAPLRRPVSDIKQMVVLSLTITYSEQKFSRSNK